MNTQQMIDTIKDFLIRPQSTKKPVDLPKRCIFCVKWDKENHKITNWYVSGSKKLFEIDDSHIHNPWFIASDLVREYFIKFGIDKCHHEQKELTEDSLRWAEAIANLLRLQTKNNYDPHELLSVLLNYTTTNKSPKILNEIINKVGESWIRSLNPLDYDGGYLEQVAKYGKGFDKGKCAPPFHSGPYKTEEEWFEQCGCPECVETHERLQEYRRKEIEECDVILS